VPFILASSTPYFLGAAVFYLVLLVTLGILTIRKGHWIIFIIGIFIPIIWLLGAILPPARRRY
jgi:hypothetical protein